MVAALALCMVMAACSTSEPEPERGGVSPDYVSEVWVKREAMLHTFDRMLIEGDPEEVLESSTGSRGDLFESHVLHEDEDGYSIEFDKGEWRTDEAGGIVSVDVALVNAMDFNEVTWCEEAVTGDEFVDAYMDEHWETLDSQEEYTASIADYVDCGDGRV
ncbi:hypothetical protein [Nocardiopsis xinjiangensis]|uniref:hypothetical protein n=1 Tax=Nocardiopsis xinjiangensis TaxID=124285 RepID=UPI001F4C72F3|nr:hypothetical protein [Nocardiopsis xinjiangensis]